MLKKGTANDNFRILNNSSNNTGCLAKYFQIILKLAIKPQIIPIICAGLIILDYQIKNLFW